MEIVEHEEDQEKYLGYFTRLAAEGKALDPHKLPPPHQPPPLRKYLAFAQRVTDAPLIYHEAVFWSVVGAAIGRRAYVQIGAQHVYSNFYTVLLGPSSIARKSTCIQIGELLATMLELRRLPAEVTPEALFEKLADNSDGIMILPEMSVLFAVARKKYGQGLIEMLLQLYDSPEKIERATVKKGTLVIAQPHFNILGACTLGHMRITLSSADVLSGLTPRMLFVSYPGKTEEYGAPRPLQEEAFAEFGHGLREFLAIPLAKRYDTTDMARKENEAFHAVLTAYVNKSYPDWGPALAARLHVIASKIALVSAVASGHAKIKARDYEAAAMFCARLFINADDYGQLFGASVKGAELILKVAAIIQKQGTISRRILMNTMYPYLGARDLDQVIATLRDNHLVATRKKKLKEDSQRASTVYEWLGGNGR